jgi:histidinol-phosphate aminotransferase
MSYFRPEIDALAGYVPGEQPQQGKFIKLNTNENPYPASPQVLRAIQSVSPERLARYPDPAAAAFRSVAAEMLGVPAGWILCGNGSDELLTVVIRAFVGQKNAIRMPYPSYLLYETLCDIQGAVREVVFFNRDWSLGDAFSAPSAGLRLAVLANPNSPSGTALDPERILQIAQNLPCPLLVDEAYVDFADRDCLELVGRCERIMVSRSLSKSYALAGLRFGYLVAQPILIEKLMQVKDSYNCDVLSIVGATAAIADQDWRRQNRATILATRGRMAAELAEFGFEVAPSQANFLWCTHRQTAVKPLYERLKEERILVRYIDFADWGDGLRITVGSDEQVDACLLLLRKML